MMKTRFILTFFLSLLVNTTLLAQENTDSLIVALNEDLDYFQKVIEKTHPIIYLHVEKAELDSIFAESRFDSTKVLSNVELEKRVRKVLSKIGCSHTYVVSPQRKAKYVFPLKFYATGKEMFIVEDLDSLLDLSQPLKLLDINGNTSEDMIKEMLNYRASDGYNTTLKYQLINLSKWFSTMYDFYFDADTIKNIRFVNANHDTLQITRKVKKIKPNKSVSKNNDYDSKYGENVTIKYYNDSVAVLRIKSFRGSFFIGSMINNRRYKKALKEIEAKRIKNLIIDLRYNTGGDGMSGFKLASRFINEKQRINIQYHGGGILRYATWGSKGMLVLNAFLGNLFSKRIPLIIDRKSFVSVRPKRKLFTGKVYVLTNGLTASTSGIVASLFKYRSDAVLMGEETGGAENTLNGYVYPRVKLPNSKIKIQIPRYRIDVGVTDRIGSGVVPDIEIDNMLRYTGEGDDGILNKAMQLIFDDSSNTVKGHPVE